MKKALGYVRVSTSSQEHTLERQADWIKALAKRKGYSLEIISDGVVSGYKSNRLGFQRLIKLCKTKGTDVVIVYDLSRLSRSKRDTLKFIEDAEKNNIEFISLSEKINTTSATGKTALAFTAMINQLYREDISFKTKMAFVHKREKGEWLGGKVPYGKVLTSEGKLVQNDEEYKVLALIKKLRSEGHSLRGICSELERNKILTKSGNIIWQASTIKAMLDKP